jgi:catechol 2,3-dioxygenase-like lactoylglutathione lyase family enzyme
LAGRSGITRRSKRCGRQSSRTVRFSGLTLLVRDIARSLDYYSKIPGASILVNTPEFAMLRFGKGSRLGLLSSKSGRGFHIEFVTTELESIFRKISPLSTGKTAPPSKRPWGERAFTVKDPDGYRIEFEDGGQGME